MKDVILEVNDKYVNVDDITTDDHRRLAVSGERGIGV
jgi:hypothetical protein